MDLLSFFIKSNAFLRRDNNLDSVVIDCTELLQTIAGCPVSIILRKTNKAFGQPCTVDILRETGPVLSMFSWNNHPAFYITDGIVLLWSHACSPVPLSIAISQTDIIIHTLILQDELQKVAETDGLTGLYNRRYFMERFTEETSKGKNPGFILLDIDHFKQYNDSFGHPEGDKLLNQFGSLLKNSIRSTDEVGRCGGEEFGILIPNCSRENLIICGEKIRITIETQLVPPLTQRPVTASLGGSISPEDGNAMEELYRVADERMYKAKEGGRNRVVA